VSQQPSICRIVTAVGFRARSNGTDVCPAVITRVWGEKEDGTWTVNATLFRDNAAPQAVSSVSLWPDEESARGALSAAENVTALHWPAR
jgi:hypothetical protein